MAPREGELFKEKIEVSLDGRQVFSLFCGGAVIACLVFVLGVMVGRRVEARAQPDQAMARATASDPLAALDQLAADDSLGEGRLAFPSALRGGGGAPLGPIDEELGGEPAASMSLTDASEPAGGKAAAAKDDPAGQEAAKPDAAKPDAARPEPKAEAAAKEAPAAEPAAKSETPADKARFTLQLSSFQDRAEAEAFQAELKKAGYPAYIIQADVDGKGVWYRVRLGHYATYDDAIAGKKEFEARQQIIAYVTRL